MRSHAATQISVDPIDTTLVIEFVRAARWHHDLTEAQALTMLCALAGHTSTGDAMIGLGIAQDTAKNLRYQAYARLGAVDLSHAVALLWRTYAPLRQRALRRAMAQRGYIAA